MPRRKPGPKPRPIAQVKRHAVMVKFDDAEFRALRARANGLPLAVYLRSLAVPVAA